MGGPDPVAGEQVAVVKTVLAWIRTVVTLAAVIGMVATAPAAQAIAPPVVDPAAVAPNEHPHQQEEMRPTGCAQPGLLEGTDVGAPPPSQAFMNLPALWASVPSRGEGIGVGMIDTGVLRSPRLPNVVGAGDYIADTDGTVDCDSHGTVVASIIGGQPSESDGFSGIAPGVQIVSVRQSSFSFVANGPSSSGDREQDRRAGTVSSLALGLRWLADWPGIRVINISVVACIPVLKPVDQTVLGATLRYAAVEKNIVLVAAAGNTGARDCAQNPDIDVTNGEDPRNWAGVVTESAPGWFKDYVLTVAATDTAGQPAVNREGRELSLMGPWVGVGAPGIFAEGFNERGELVNAVKDDKEILQPLHGTSFAAPQVAGLAALIRAKYPSLTAPQVIRRITATAHSPAGIVDSQAAAVVDNRVGYGTIDPVAALNADVNVGEPWPVEHLERRLIVPPPPPPPNRAPRAVALIGAASLFTLLGALFGARRLARTRRKEQK